MRRKVLSLFAIVLIVLTGCSHDSDKTGASRESNDNSIKEELSTKKDVPSSFSFTYNDQKFEIVYFYENFIEYIKEAEMQPGNLDGLYIETIINPIAEERGVRLSKGWGFGTPTQLEILEKYLQSLIDNHDTIQKLIIDSLKKSADKLQPGSDKTIFVLPANPVDKDVMESVVGVSAVTWNENFISLQIAPPFFEESSLKRAVAHEYHHTVFFENNEMGNTLLESVLIEGKADTFAKIIYPDIQMPWSNFSSAENERQTWKVLKENTSSLSPAIQDDFFLGDPSKGIPEWANYKIGNKIMESFIEEYPSISISEWTDMPADEILTKSNYEEKH